MFTIEIFSYYFGPFPLPMKFELSLRVNLASLTFLTDSITKLSVKSTEE